MLPGLVSSGISAITRGGPRRQYKWNKKAAEWNQSTNRANQEWLLEQNKRLQEEQRIYDDPKSQMARYKAAGLNPHLIYGGSGSAGGAFPIDAGSMPPANVQAPSAQYADVGSSFLQAGQTIAQTNLAEARAGEVAMSTAYKSVLIDIAKSNPMLKPGVAEAIAEMTQSTAMLKARESQYMRDAWMDRDRDHSEKLYVAKIRMELENELQRLGLNTVDLEIKNKILESKEFENFLKEIQVKWMRDNEITPQLILQSGMQILKQLLGAGLQK